MEFLSQMVLLVGGILAIIAATPPAWRKLHPLFHYLRNYALRDILQRLKHVEKHLEGNKDNDDPAGN